MAVDTNLMVQSEETGDNAVPTEVVSVDVALTPTATGTAATQIAASDNDQQPQQQQNGAGHSDFPGLSALKNAIGAIGDAMAELAETSAQRLFGRRQSDNEVAEGQQHSAEGEERVENVSLAAAGEAGMATTNEHNYRSCQQLEGTAPCAVMVSLNEADVKEADQQQQQPGKQEEEEEQMSMD